MKKIELLSPAGDFEKLKTAIHFGCDAVYFAGKRFGLRAFSDNFDDDEIIKAIKYAHDHNVKVYITVNILAHNDDFNGLLDYLKFLDQNKADGVIVSDLGIAKLVLDNTDLELHVSTQANITNLYSAKVWQNMGAKRLVLARELNLKEIYNIKKELNNDIDIETFIHGAMCISYSGRCLLSNYLTGRDSNKGACAQPCRWNYALGIKDDKDDISYYPIQEDNKGTYILNSKDLCLINNIKDLYDAGINSFKIEGRMKSNYYVATITNAYRRAIDDFYNNKESNFDYISELQKTSNREFTTGFYFDSDQKTNTLTSKVSQTYIYTAVVLDYLDNNYLLVEHRNKFKLGDTLEVLSPDENFNKTFKVEEILDLNKNNIEEVKKIKQQVYIKCPYKLHKLDILRMKIDHEE